VALALAGAVRAWSLRLAVLLSLVVAPGTAWASRGDASAAALKLAEHQVAELPELLSALDQVDDDQAAVRERCGALCAQLRERLALAAGNVTDGLFGRTNDAARVSGLGFPSLGASSWASCPGAGDAQAAAGPLEVSGAYFRAGPAFDREAGRGVFAGGEVRLRICEYAYNNPTVYVDPDGRSATLVGTALGFAWGVGQAIGGYWDDTFQGNYGRSFGDYLSVVGQNTIGGFQLGLAADMVVVAGGAAALPGVGAPVRGAIGGLIGAGTGALTFAGKGQTWTNFAANQVTGAGVGAAIGVVPELGLAAAAYGAYQGFNTAREGNWASVAIGVAEITTSIAPFASKGVRSMTLDRLGRTSKGLFASEGPISLFGGAPVPKIGSVTTATLAAPAATAAAGSRLSFASRTAARALQPVFRYLGGRTRYLQTTPGTPLSRTAQARRFFFQDARSYPGVRYGTVGRFLAKRFPARQWQQGHTFMQRKWIKPGGAHQWYPNDPLAHAGLQRFTDAGWNLTPQPARMNRVLGNSEWKTSAVAAGVGASLAAGLGAAYWAAEEALDWAEQDEFDEFDE
jgi:hypothetical protein